MKEITTNEFYLLDFIKEDDEYVNIKGDYLDVFNLNLTDDFKIEDSFLEKHNLVEIRFNNCKFGLISITNLLNSFIVIFKDCIINLLSSFNNKTEAFLEIEGSETRIHTIDIKNSKLLNLRVFDGEFKHLKITSPINSLKLSGGNYEWVLISDPAFNKTKDKYKEIKITPPLIGERRSTRLYIKDLFIYSSEIEDLLVHKVNTDYFELKGNISSQSKYVIRDILVNKFRISGLINLGKISLSLVKSPSNSEDSSFSILISELGFIEFRDVDLKGFKVVEVEHSDLSSLMLYHSSFPSNINGSPSELYDVYNDLYSSALKRNNTKDKVDYYKATQENLLKVKCLEPKSRERLASIIGLKLSKWFSDFGTDWLKVIGRILIVSIPVYLVLLSTLTNSVIDLSIESILNSASRYFLFINPLRGIDFVEGLGSYSWLSIVIDFFYRIFIAIAIFELIRSFRKYVRK